MGSQDTEITLGTGKMLALFFSLVALCGLFFGLGFSLGRGSVRPLSGPEQAQAPVGPALRNSVMKSNGGGVPQTSEGMTLYKNGEQKEGNPPVPQTDATPKSSSKESGTQNSSAPPDPMTATAGPGYFVQVAAVSKQDDAQALVDALKKKQYAAFTSNTSPVDKFFHVQVGPFGDIKEAEATKAKLIGDGYNPILKK
jgi:cell division septation protein DedD